jgi:hypothetical protein
MAPLSQQILSVHPDQQADAQVCPSGQLPLWQIPPQPSLAPHDLPVQSGTHTQIPPWHVSPVAQQTEPHTLAVGQHIPLRQVLPEQHSVSPLQVPSPLGMQLTHVPLDSSQIPEQHCASLVQPPSSAIQQVPLLHVCVLEQQVLLPVLLVQTFALGQHDPPIQVVLPVHATPLPQTQV